MYHFQVSPVWKDRDDVPFAWRLTVKKGDQVLYFEQHDTFAKADAAARRAQKELAKDEAIEYLQLSPEMFQNHPTLWDGKRW